MKTADRRVKHDHVRISFEITQAEDFRQYLGVSRDSFVLGVGRIAVLCLDVLRCKKTYYSTFELDRVVQWPADRRLTFAQVLVQVGWAVPETNSIVRLELPDHFIPRRPYRERAALVEASPKGDDGKFISKADVERKIQTRTGSPVVLVDMDGYSVENLDGFDSKEAGSPRRKARRIKPIIV